MKAPLFEFPSYQYEVSDWEFKKKGLLSRINKSKFLRTELQTFETDRQTCEKSYVRYFEQFLQHELFEFCQEAQVSCGMSDAWCVKYQKGDHQTVHNHRGWGFSGILYVEYDPKVNTPPTVNAPPTFASVAVRRLTVTEGVPVNPVALPLKLVAVTTPVTVAPFGKSGASFPVALP